MAEICAAQSTTPSGGVLPLLLYTTTVHLLSLLHVILNDWDVGCCKKKKKKTECLRRRVLFCFFCMLFIFDV